MIGPRPGGCGSHCESESGLCAKCLKKPIGHGRLFIRKMSRCMGRCLMQSRLWLLNANMYWMDHPGNLPQDPFAIGVPRQHRCHCRRRIRNRSGHPRRLKGRGHLPEYRSTRVSRLAERDHGPAVIETDIAGRVRRQPGRRTACTHAEIQDVFEDVVGTASLQNDRFPQSNRSITRIVGGNLGALVEAPALLRELAGRRGHRTVRCHAVSISVGANISLQEKPVIRREPEIQEMRRASSARGNVARLSTAMSPASFMSSQR